MLVLAQAKAHPVIEPDNVPVWQQLRIMEEEPVILAIPRIIIRYPTKLYLHPSALSELELLLVRADAI